MRLGEVFLIGYAIGLVVGWLLSVAWAGFGVSASDRVEGPRSLSARSGAAGAGGRRDGLRRSRRERNR